MGWASYLEDISLRAAESRGGGFVSAPNAEALEEARRARVLEEVRRAQVMEEARRERGLAAANERQWKRRQQVSRLRDTYARLDRRIAKELHENEWQDLSARMDGVSREVANLPVATLLAGQELLYLAETDLAGKIDAVIGPAKKAIGDLEAMQDDISDEQESVTFIAQRVKESAKIDGDAEASEKAALLARGYRTLASQVAHCLRALQQEVAAMEERAVDLNIQMADGIFERAMANPWNRPEDKDRDF